MTKDHIFREARKLLDILNRWGDCLVPSIYPDGRDTTAKKRLEWILARAKEEHRLSVDDVQSGINTL